MSHLLVSFLEVNGHFISSEERSCDQCSLATQFFSTCLFHVSPPGKSAQNFTNLSCAWKGTYPISLLPSQLQRFDCFKVRLWMILDTAKIPISYPTKQCFVILEKNPTPLEIFFGNIYALYCEWSLVSSFQLCTINRPVLWKENWSQLEKTPNQLLVDILEIIYAHLKNLKRLMELDNLLFYLTAFPLMCWFPWTFSFTKKNGL